MQQAAISTIVRATIGHTVKAMDGGFLGVNLNGAELWLPPATIRTMTHCINVDEIGKFYLHVEPSQFDWLFNHLMPGDQLIDVGAATGAICLPVAKRFGPSVAITAFEPAGPARGLLAATAARNQLSWIKIIGKAVSDRPGRATFYEFPQDDTAITPFLPETSTLEPVRDPRARPVTVPVTTLDAEFSGYLARRRTRRRILMKIDVEGFEARVLAGARRFIARNRPAMVIDIHRNPFGDGTTEADVRAILGTFDYRFDRMDYALACVPAWLWRCGTSAQNGPVNQSPGTS